MRVWFIVFALACGQDDTPPTVEASSTTQPNMTLGSPGTEVVRLLDRVDAAELELSSGQARKGSASKQWVLKDWELVRSNPVRVWAHPSPVRTTQGIYPEMPEDLRLVRDGDSIDYLRGIAAGRPVKQNKMVEGRWEYHRNQIVVVTDGDPQEQNILLKSLGDAGADNRFDFGLANLSASDFVKTSLENGLETRMALLLPAPSAARFRVEIPSDAKMRFGYGLGQSAESGQEAEARFSVSINGETVWTEKTNHESGWQDVEIGLETHAGQTVQIGLHTEPVGNKAYAYSGFASPEVVGPPTLDGPRRIIVVGMDTLRADHLQTHGYARTTSPGLKQIAQQSVVFEEAWTPAPRTRPSFRSATTGRWPAQAVDAPTIGKVMRQNGFATGGFVANIQLAPHLGFAEGFDHWSYDNMADSDIQVDRTLTWLTERSHEDAFVFLHLMDPHIFYNAPEPYKDRFTEASDQQGLKPKFNRWEILRLRKKDKLSPEQERWIEGRYDGEIAFMDHHLTRLVQAVDKLPGRTLWVFHTDHGEEFFEHDSFEHNHSLYSELMRAVFWIRPPGGWGGGPHRIEHPVSLVDIAPTIFATAEIPEKLQPPVDGLDLSPFVFQDRSTDKEPLATQLEDRPLPIGHMMYNAEQWGVIFRDQKYIIETGSGKQQWYDLAEDPNERTNKATKNPPSEMVDALARAHGWPVLYGWRVKFTSLKKETTLRFSKPIGEALVIEPEALRKRRANLEWGETPPVSKSDVAQLVRSDDGTELVIQPGSSGTGVIFIEGLEEADTVSVQCAIGNSKIAPNQRGKLCDRRADVHVGPYLALRDDMGVQRSVPEEATIKALQSLGYLE